MKIRKIMISFDAQEKIFKKHNVRREEIEQVFFGEPYYFKTKSSRYYAIGLAGRYVTVVFEYEKGCASIITAYKSSKWQTRLYKVKR